MGSNFHSQTETPLQELEGIESLINQTIGFASQAVLELSRETPRIKHSENHNTSCLKSMERIDACLGKQIHYLKEVSTGQAHQGSCYAHAKDTQMAFHRLEHIRSRVGEMIHNSEERALHVAIAPPAGSKVESEQEEIDALIL